MMAHDAQLLAVVTLVVLAGVAGCRAPGEATRPASQIRVSTKVHAFYYPWYANPATDGQWGHWNHRVVTREGPGRRYQPPEDIAANFYPELGCYSSSSIPDLTAHMRQARDAGIGVLSLSWWGQGTATDRVVPPILQVAAAHGIKVSFHIEPYPRRSASSVAEDIAYLIDRYGDAPAFYRCPEYGNRPVFYVYDSYLVNVDDWSTVLTPATLETIRGTPRDAVVLALWVSENDGSFVLNGGFDGFYTYFATDGFTYGSTISNWPRLARWASEHEKIFVPSVGPGYADTRIRPWNKANQRSRAGGAYYDEMWQAAIDTAPPIISITSFNEWHEGTQIEPAVPKAIPGYTYSDYRPLAPDGYLERTRYWIDRFLAATLAHAVSR